MSKLNNIPKHWQVKKLGEYVVSVKGKKPKRISKVKTKECSIPYVNIKAFEKNVIDEYTDGVGCVLCEKDDFLMVWDGSRSGFVGKSIKGALGSTLVKLNFPDINNDYAYYFLQSKFIEINTRAKGVGIPHVDPNLLWNYELLIPPKETQQLIVSKIEELFSELDKGVESLKTAQQQLKVYRQSLLKWAFEGKLTKSEFRSQNSELAMAAEGKEKYRNGELPEGWRMKKLSELSVLVSDGDHLPPPKSESGIPFITISNIKNNTIDFSQTMFMTEKYYNELKESRKPIKGDILYSVTGSFGIPVLINFDKKFCFQRHIGLIRPQKSTNTKWLFYILQSPQIFKQATETATGTAQKTVALKSLRNFDIPLPPISDQQLIVSELESKLTVCDKIEETINNGLQQSEGLRQSILKQAFEGRLV